AFGLGKHRQVDDYSFGGNAGMVLRPEPLFDCIESLEKERAYDAIIYTTPDGKRFDQKVANQLSLKGNLM
ncbi:MAG TPA: tRNA (guanosine(37)-N1)-methyltransferase TrmD, partial [Cryomorphaceae bacterium]|nr:tRNA (guanosine(37)-N1)-methyltransferase TrmD [Cryomorphaceae bacterium]